MSKEKQVVYTSFDKFYKNLYLVEHLNPINRLLHFIGTTFVFILFATIIAFAQWKSLYLIPICGYGFAWVGHFVFEKNKPATFKYPFYSLLGDFRMWFEIVIGKIKINGANKPWKANDSWKN